MLHKTFIISFLLFFTLNSTNAQQNECPQFEWVKGAKCYLTERNIYSYFPLGEVQVDNSGNIYALLNIKGSEDIEPININIGGHLIPMQFKDNEFDNLLIVKFDKDLNLLWTNRLYATLDTGYLFGGKLYSIGLQLDARGNVYIAGNFKGSRGTVTNPLAYSLHCNNKTIKISTVTIPPSGYMDGFLLKLNRTNGNAFWLKKMAGITSVDLKMSVNDYIYMPFITRSDTVTIDNQQYTGIFERSGIARFNALGELQWITWGGTDTRYKYRGVANASGIPASRQKVIDIDAQDNVYTFELFDSTITKIDSMGQIQWHRVYPNTYGTGSGTGLPYFNIHIDNSGRLYMIGGMWWQSQLIEFDNGDTLTSGVNGSAVLWQLDAGTGQTVLVGRLWNHPSDSTRIYLLHTTSDQYGNLYISGYVRGKDSVQLGDSVFVPTSTIYPLLNGEDAFISKVQPPAEGMGNAKFIWTLRSEGAGTETAYLANTSSDGTEHYFYSAGGDLPLQYGEGKFGNHYLADTYRVQGTLFSEVSFYFGKINTDCSLPTKEIANPLQSVTIYPNPAHTNITINNLPPNSTIHLTDISGRVLYTQYNKTNSTAQIPVNSMGSGMYFVQIINGESMVNRKVVVNR